MISYAQNGEDVVLNRLFRRDEGFYVDVGAHDPVHLSVTKHFYDRGWRGINVEPEPGVFASLCAHRPHDVNLNIGISDHEGVMDFFESPAASGWSTFSKEHADSLRARGLEVHTKQLSVSTLADVFRKYVDRPIDFLKVDAESHEYEVLSGGDWRRWRPRVVLVESGPAPAWEPLLLEADYLFALFDGINRYYVSSEESGLLSMLETGANFMDDYVPYTHRLQLDEYRARLAPFDGLTPRAAACARKIQRVCHGVPGLPWLLRKIVPAA